MENFPFFYREKNESKMYNLSFFGQFFLQTFLLYNWILQKKFQFLQIRKFQELNFKKNIYFYLTLYLFNKYVTNFPKKLSLSHKLKFLNSYTFATLTI